jgi:spermidine synthase
MTKKPGSKLPQVHFSDQGPIRYLHLESEWVQGSMKLDSPFEIHLDYVQRMMAGLLFTDLKQLKQLHAMQLGLGAASLTKFCFKKLQMHTTAIEINPQVVAACRIWFKLPADSSRLSVILADAQQVVTHDHWRTQVDLLHVDLYDQEAAAPVLDDLDFYRGCRHLLTDGGSMTVNLFGRDHGFDQSLARIVEAFGADCVWVFKPTREGNTVVLALRTPVVHERQYLLEQAQTIESTFGLPAQRWLRVLRKYQ